MVDKIFARGKIVLTIRIWFTSESQFEGRFLKKEASFFIGKTRFVLKLERRKKQVLSLRARVVKKLTPRSNLNCAGVIQIDEKEAKVNKKLILSVFFVLSLVITVMAAEAKPVQLALFNPVQMVPESESIKGVSLALIYASNQDVTGLDFVFFGVNEVKGEGKGVGLGLGNWVEGLFHGWQAGFVNRVGARFVGLQSGMLDITIGDLTGAQMGMVNWTEGFVHGAQAGIFNYSTGRFIGAQLGAVNMAKGEFSGAALGIVNYAEASVKGFQGGIVNSAGEMHGLQLGLVNYTKNLDGLQIGLANYNGNKEPLEFMVFVNWSF